MNQNNPKSFIIIIIITLISTQIPGHFCQNPQYEACRRPFNCGGVTGLTYPFYGGDRPPSCGHPEFNLICSNTPPLINISSILYQILEINQQSQTLRIARQDLISNNLCPQFQINTTLDFNIFDYYQNPNYRNVTLFYGCAITVNQFPNQFNCTSSSNGAVEGSAFYVVGDIEAPGLGLRCGESVFVPVNETAALALAVPGPWSLGILRDAIVSGFWVRWFGGVVGECVGCVGSGGVCGRDLGSGAFACFCADGAYDETCGGGGNGTENGNGNGSNRTGMQIGLPIAGAVLAGVGLGWLIFYCKQRRKRQHLSPTSSLTALTKEITPLPSSKSSSTPSTAFTKSIPSFPSSKSDSGRDNSSSYFGVQVFSYSELEEATDNFNASRELGDGGFGTVYYGTLYDNRIVAVKRLYENNFKRVEQFMNEVEILARIRHENLVALYGCSSKRSRELLLVYEYIPNGTVADHLHGKRAKSGLLSWTVRLNIAIETALALAYLHKSDIIHRDVKTNNILLDNDFHVKVADFGLSRLFPNDVTHVSTAPQGTPGYVDPEYYRCYHLTEKSDVYSFGVVLIELISSLQAVDTNRHKSDINLSNMAISKIQNHMLHELVDSSLGFETDNVVRRMATLVAELAFRCLQEERDMRPSMDEALECLRGIKNEDLNAHKVEIVDSLVDEDVGLLKGDTFVISSPDSDEKWTSGRRSF